METKKQLPPTKAMWQMLESHSPGLSVRLVGCETLHSLLIAWKCSLAMRGWKSVWWEWGHLGLLAGSSLGTVFQGYSEIHFASSTYVAQQIQCLLFC